jgi:hypothetical protein
MAKLTLKKGKPPHPKRFNLDTKAAPIRGALKVKGSVGWKLPQPFNLEGSEPFTGQFAIAAVRGKLDGHMGVRGNVGWSAGVGFDLQDAMRSQLLGVLKVKGDVRWSAPVAPVAFDLEGAGAEVWSYDLEGA